MSTPQDAHAITARLRALAQLKPTPQRRAEVELMLDHKWEGVQSVAAQVLGEWGGPESVEALRQWLLRLYERPAGESVRGVAAQALARCVSEADIRWVLNLYLGLGHWHHQHELLPLIAGLPTEPTVERLRAAARGEHREAADRALTRLAALNDAAQGSPRKR